MSRTSRCAPYVESHVIVLQAFCEPTRPGWFRADLHVMPRRGCADSWWIEVVGRGSTIARAVGDAERRAWALFQRGPFAAGETRTDDGGGSTEGPAAAAGRVTGRPAEPQTVPLFGEEVRA